MKTETIEKILNFLKEKEGKEIPRKWFESIKRLKFINELENYPDGTQYRYEGHLLLYDSNIKKLPNDLYVDGLFDLDGCKQLTKLPDNLYVVSYLAIERTSIEDIPDKLYVGRNLYINNTPLSNKYTDEEIREMITSKGGTLIGKIIR
jgi:hypothetical protein